MDVFRVDSVWVFDILWSSLSDLKLFVSVDEDVVNDIDEEDEDFQHKMGSPGPPVSPDLEADAYDSTNQAAGGGVVLSDTDISDSAHPLLGTNNSNMTTVARGGLQTVEEDDRKEGGSTSPTRRDSAPADSTLSPPRKPLRSPPRIMVTFYI